MSHFNKSIVLAGVTGRVVYCDMMKYRPQLDGRFEESCQPKPSLSVACGCVPRRHWGQLTTWSQRMQANLLAFGSEAGCYNGLGSLAVLAVAGGRKRGA